jgi:hypothetical protein
VLSPVSEVFAYTAVRNSAQQVAGGAFLMSLIVAAAIALTPRMRLRDI